MKVVDEPNRGFEPDQKRVYIFCPGCALVHPEFPPIHCMNVTRVHTFDGNYERPTFSPSLMAARGNDEVCHSYVRDGMIQFLDDCTHPLKGQTVPLLDVPAEYLDGTAWGH